MPDFSELYADMIKRSRAKAFEAIEAVYGGDNEYIPVAPAVKQAVDDFAALEAAHFGPRPLDDSTLNAIFYGDFAPDPRRFTDFVQPSLTFSVSSNRCGWPAYDLEEAVIRTRMGWTLKPNRDLVGSDFADFGDRKLLAELGYFSVDLPKHRAKRDREAQREAYLDQAYDVLHLDRKAVHAMIAAKLEATRFDGIWARSTGEYSEACRKVDMTVLARSPAIAQSIQELGQ